MPITLPISKLIQVSVTLTQSAAQGPDLNSAMIVGDSTIIDTGARFREYLTLDEVAIDFGTTAPEYLAADVFFSQNPQPQTLYIGRWAKTASHGKLVGGALAGTDQVISGWTGITNGDFLAIIDGVPFNISGLNLSGALNMSGVASLMQTALSAVAAGATVTYDANYDRFTIGSGTTGAASSVGFLQPSGAVGNIVFNTQPAAGETLTVNGTAITFIASGAPVGNQVVLGADVGHTAQATLAFLNASQDANLSASTYWMVGNTIWVAARAAGTAGNSYTLATNSTHIAVSGATLQGGVVGTDLSTKMRMTAPSFTNQNGAYAAPGVAAETALQAVQAIEAVFSNWYGLTFAAGAGNDDISDADHLAIAAYIEGDGNRHLYGITTSEGAALVTGDSTSIGAQLHSLGYNRSFVQWSSKNAYAAASLLGLGCTVNFNGSNTVINFAWKQQPGVGAENLNPTQAAALDANDYNYFTAFNNATSIVVNGSLASGHYIDEIWNADWFASQLQTAAWNVLYTTPTKIPQTDAGMAIIATALKQVCAQAARNGFLGPGTWNSAGFGQLAQFQWMPTGYYVFVPPIANQNVSDRAKRKSVPFQIAAKETGAVNDISVSVVVNQ
jgi:hypothetical protein